MKRILFSVSAVLMATLLSAAPRSLHDAQAVANKFLTSDANRVMRMAPNSQRLKLAHTALQADQKPAFYVFNNGDDNGFVVVSADDNAREVLGYSETGSFNEADMPENMRVWFQHYAEEIAWAAANGKAARQQTPKRSISPVEPLLQTKWNQDKPYNDLCPIDQTDNTKAATGCVATAAAQIMKYWNHPVQGVGSHTDNWDNSGAYSDYQGKGKGSEFADFGATTYDWDNMLNSYKGSYNETQAKAVATLMYHVGVSCDMTYGGDEVGGSGAMTADMARALYTYFKYDKSMQYILMESVGIKKFEQLYIEELKAGRPILMGGATKDGAGHEFVCDGVNADGLFHINWGWGGLSDDYFVLSALDPDEQGIGGAASKNGFSVSVEAVIGIKPDEGGSLKAPVITVEPYEGSFDFKFSKTEASKTENITFSTDLAYNWGPCDVTNAPIVYAVYNEDSTFVKAFGSDKFSMTAGGGNYQSLSFKGSFNGLAAGKYLLAIAFRMNDTDDWTNIGFYGTGAFINLEATEDKVIIGDLVQPQNGGGGGGNSDIEGNLDVTSANLFYDSSDKSTPWSLQLTDEDTWAPYIEVYFKGVSKTKVAGTYNVKGNVQLYFDYEDEDYVSATSGTLKLVCRAAETDEDYAQYEIWLEFVGDNGKEYSVHGTFYLPATDSDTWDDISLADEVVIPSAIEQTTIDQPKAVKILQNGQIVIKLSEKTYNILGAQL
jgi:hypothetical protein